MPSERASERMSELDIDRKTSEENGTDRGGGVKTRNAIKDLPFHVRHPTLSALWGNFETILIGLFGGHAGTILELY